MFIFLKFIVFLIFCALVLIWSSYGSDIESIKNKIFFLEQAENCEENDTLIEHFENKNVITKSQKRRLLNQITRRTNFHTYNRQLQTQGQPNVRSRIKPTSLSKQSLHQRRDEAIALLDLIVFDKQAELGHRRRLGEKKTSSQKYLRELNIDIIDNELLPNDELFNIASQLPCLKYAPEKNDVRFILDSEDDVDFDLMNYDLLKTASNVQYTPIVSESFVIPNDPFAQPRSRVYQWHLRGPFDDIDSNRYYGANLYKAWARFRGENRNMVIGVVDSGCSMHPDLEKNLCQPGSSCEGKDYGNYLDHPFRETLYHGTSMAGAIAGDTNNALHTAGVCWGCKLMCLKINREGTKFLTLEASLKAMDYMLFKKIKLSNHSYRGLKLSEAESSAIAKLQKQGHILVVAAGNMACNADNGTSIYDYGCIYNNRPVGPLSPMGYDYDNIVVVGNIDSKGEKSFLSNWGKYNVDVMAPGENIILPVNTRLSKSGVANITGTSASAAIVSGIIGLVWASNPNLSYEKVLDALYSTVVKKDSLKELCRTGGIVDAEAALIAANGIKETFDAKKYENSRSLVQTDKTNLFYINSAIKLNLILLVLLWIKIFF